MGLKINSQKNTPAQFRMDKGFSKAQSFEEADNQYAYWKDKSPEERLAAAAFLIAQAYGMPDFLHEKMDKTYFSVRKHEV